MERLGIRADADSLKEEIIRLRRDIHMHPELGNEEHRTAALVEETLRGLGIETRRIAGTGVVGILRGNAPGQTVALRADMDALPIPEENEVAYASLAHGKMHACGHDMHTAGLLGAAVLLSRRRERLAGNVKFLFQPAEESSGGALPMIEGGALENPTVDAVFGLHCTPELPTGTMGVAYGKAYAASDSFDVVIRGKACHGAVPQNGIDAIVVGAQVVSALQTFVSRNMDPVDSAVVTIGKFNGGYQSNIIADRVELSGIIRTLDSETRRKAIASVGNMIQGVTVALGAASEITFTEGYPPLINHRTMVDFVRKTAEEVLGPGKAVVLEKPTMTVEDFAYFLQKAPGAFFQLGVRNEGKGLVHPLHSGRFDADEDALPLAAAMHAQIALSFLRQSEG